MAHQAWNPVAAAAVAYIYGRLRSFSALAGARPVLQHGWPGVAWIFPACGDRAGPVAEIVGAIAAAGRENGHKWPSLSIRGRQVSRDREQGREISNNL